MIVDLDYINACKKAFAKINAENIDDITFISNGETITLTPEQIENFKLMGLNNTDILLVLDSLTQAKIENGLIGK
jgi:hypothetical protein